MKRPSRAYVDWSAIDAVILDVDGTLFDHVALRRPLVARMAAQLVAGNLGWQDLRTLFHFRRERNRLALDEAEAIGLLQYERAAAAARRPTAEVEATVSRWMHREPLAFVARYAFQDARAFVAALEQRGIRSGVFSDYPAQEKLDALQIPIRVVRDAASIDVGRLKPNPAGLLRVAALLEVSPPRCLVIGDRDDRDGEAARRGGFRFLRKVGPRERPRYGGFSTYVELIQSIEEPASDAA